ncbi:hypothetical protein EWM64_g4488 [Hericium alpestre]|uniref:Uncharacterized protein n=1 Tax=Hericium alpestre TaxID=135208 RepID=A0A4Z0A153_9AGAM|nr:hypothetical protein EWM64_g4488 [Hericium alpestre]
MASTSTSLPPLTEAQLAEALALRTAQRAKRASEKEKLAEEHKEKGNAKFKAQDYEGAVACYEEAMKVNGPRTAVLSNMALAYLKAEEYEAAEGAAQRALLHDPTFTKARYRRALARKGQDNILGAMLDIEVVLKQDPNLTEAKAVFRELNHLMDAPDYELDDVGSEDEYPDLDEPKVEIESASDSSDWNHEGNGIPCRYYNHNGCSKERDCMDFQH